MDSYPWGMYGNYQKLKVAGYPADITNGHPSNTKQDLKSLHQDAMKILSKNVPVTRHEFVFTVLRNIPVLIFHKC
jgi:hypothetical protein